MEPIPIDVLQEIFELCGIADQIVMLQVCRKWHDGLKLRELRPAFVRPGCLSNGDIKMPKFMNLQKLTLRTLGYGIVGINSVGHLAHLTYLSAMGIGSVSQSCIDKLTKLIVLDCFGNPCITSVTHLRNLTELDIGGDLCGVGQSGIAGMTRLEILWCNDNWKIFDISFMSQLTYLNVFSHSNLGDENITMLHNLKFVNCGDNSRFKKKYHWKEPHARPGLR